MLLILPYDGTSAAGKRSEDDNPPSPPKNKRTNKQKKPKKTKDICLPKRKKDIKELFGANNNVICVYY